VILYRGMRSIDCTILNSFKAEVKVRQSECWSLLEGVRDLRADFLLDNEVRVRNRGAASCAERRTADSH
jgi:hypothetical protein